jgi:hypothetical protein
MFAVSAVAGVLLALAVLTALESPRWLVKTGRPDDARRNLVALGAENDADARLAAIKAALRAEHETASWSERLARAGFPGVLPRVKAGCSQVCGREATDVSPLPGGPDAPRRAETRETEHHHRPSGSLGNPVGNDKGRASFLIVVSPESIKSVGAKIRGEAGVCIDAVILTEIDGAIRALNSVKSYTVNIF